MPSQSTCQHMQVKVVSSGKMAGNQVSSESTLWSCSPSIHLDTLADVGKLVGKIMPSSRLVERVSCSPFLKSERHAEVRTFGISPPSTLDSSCPSNSCPLTSILSPASHFIAFPPLSSSTWPSASTELPLELFFSSPPLRLASVLYLVLLR